MFVGGFYAGTDYQPVRTDGFGLEDWGTPVDGSCDMRVDYAKDRVRLQMSHDALGNPDEVRVAGTRTDGTSAGPVDWLGERHSFTRWVAPGRPST